jgi:hypothetical protein
MLEELGGQWFDFVGSSKKHPIVNTTKETEPFDGKEAFLLMPQNEPHHGRIRSVIVGKILIVAFV